MRMAQPTKLGSALFLLATSMSVGGADSLMELKSLVTGAFVDRVPYDHARRLMEKPGAVDFLSDILENQDECPAWGNAVVVLGISGDSQALKPLIRFLERDHGEIEPCNYNAKMNVLGALGYFVHGTEGDKARQHARQYLIDGLEGGNWKSELKWLGPFGANKTARDENLTREVILGLALSGDPKALKVLEDARESEQHRRFHELISEAIASNKKIQKFGLSEYYSNNLH